jgi:predicted protein tyrosine phosphatase
LNEADLSDQRLGEADAAAGSGDGDLQPYDAPAAIGQAGEECRAAGAGLAGAVLGQQTVAAMVDGEAAQAAAIGLEHFVVVPVVAAEQEPCADGRQGGSETHVIGGGADRVVERQKGAVEAERQQFMAWIIASGDGKGDGAGVVGIGAFVVAPEEMDGAGLDVVAGDAAEQAMGGRHDGAGRDEEAGAAGAEFGLHTAERRPGWCRHIHGGSDRAGRGGAGHEENRGQKGQECAGFHRSHGSEPSARLVWRHAAIGSMVDPLGLTIRNPIMNSVQPPFGITVCGIEELEGHRDTAATHVLSILDPDYPVPEAFGQYGEHERLELRFHDIIDPAPAMIPPSAENVEAILAFGRSLAAEPQPLARLIVHCHAGVSRSTAAMALILAQAMPAEPAEAILARVYGIRQKAWPNLRIVEIGDAMLGRDGSLIRAAHGLYRLQIDRRPELAEYMNDAGRGREVRAGLALA